MLRRCVTATGFQVQRALTCTCAQTRSLPRLPWRVATNSSSWSWRALSVQRSALLSRRYSSPLCLRRSGRMLFSQVPQPCRKAGASAAGGRASGQRVGGIPKRRISTTKSSVLTSGCAGKRFILLRTQYVLKFSAKTPPGGRHLAFRGSPPWRCIAWPPVRTMRRCRCFCLTRRCVAGTDYRTIANLFGRPARAWTSGRAADCRRRCGRRRPERCSGVACSLPLRGARGRRPQRRGGRHGLVRLRVMEVPPLLRAP